MNNIETVNRQLPDTLEDLSRFVLIGREKLTSVRAEIRAIEKVGLAKEVHEQKLQEAQAIAEAVLDAEVRIGELMAQVPKAKGGQPFHEKRTSDTDVESRPQTKTEVIKEAGFTPKQVERFQTLASHPEAVERAKAEAKEKGEVLSRSAVLETIKQEKKETERAEREARIAEQMAVEDSQSVDLDEADKKYRVIYADPPWSYGDKQNISGLGGAEKHYPTMPLEDICAIDVPAEDNAVLFLWVTSPLLEDAFKVINAWGFKYKSSFVWDKVKHNMGHYNSVRHEFLLIATRGSCTPDVQKLFDSVVSIERTEHSKKPEHFREIIDTLYTHGRKLEMFARNTAPGWDVWGNMV